MFEERFCEDQGIHCEIGILIFEPLNLQHKFYTHRPNSSYGSVSEGGEFGPS